MADRPAIAQLRNELQATKNLLEGFTHSMDVLFSARLREGPDAPVALMQELGMDLAPLDPQRITGLLRQLRAAAVAARTHVVESVDTLADNVAQYRAVEQALLEAEAGLVTKISEGAATFTPAQVAAIPALTTCQGWRTMFTDYTGDTRIYHILKCCATAADDKGAIYDVSAAAEKNKLCEGHFWKTNKGRPYELIAKEVATEMGLAAKFASAAQRALAPAAVRELVGPKVQLLAEQLELEPQEVEGLKARLITGLPPATQHQALADACMAAWTAGTSQVLKAKMVQLHAEKVTGEDYYKTALAGLHVTCQELFSDSARAIGWVQAAVEGWARRAVVVPAQGSVNEYLISEGLLQRVPVLLSMQLTPQLAALEGRVQCSRMVLVAEVGPAGPAA